MSAFPCAPRRALASFLAVAHLLPAAALADEAITQTKSTQADMSPAEALEMLSEGNQRFVDENMLERDLIDQVEATATGQYPFGVVLGCIDSRVPPEIVFDQGIGDIFAPRVAGNFVNADILGSMEFATAVAGSKVVVVLGHTSCGAVKGTADQVELGNLTHTLSNIAPAMYSVEGHQGERNSKNAEFVQAVAEANVHHTVQNILDRSPVMKDLVDQGKLLVVGAMHDVATGEVTWYEHDHHSSH